jgi:hypothetical protein
MTRKHKQHPDFWGRDNRGGEEWDVVDRPPGRGNELGPQGFDKPDRPPADKGVPERQVTPGASRRGQ